MTPATGHGAPWAQQWIKDQIDMAERTRDIDPPTSWWWRNARCIVWAFILSAVVLFWAAAVYFLLIT